MASDPEPKESQIEPPKEEAPKKNRLRLALTVFVLMIAGFVGFDGYINKWGTMKSLINWNTLELHTAGGLKRSFKAGKDFTLHRLENVQNIVNPDSLSVIDQPYRDQGLYRLYFRMSDSSSAKIQRLYQTMSAFDTTGQMTQKIEDVKRAYKGLRLALRLDSTSRSDSVPHVSGDSAKYTASTNLSFGSDQDVSRALGRLVKNPQVLVGLGIGAAASFGIGLLEGEAYVAVAPLDAFGFDSLMIGSRSALWEGKPIDILWTLAKEDTSRSPQPPSPIE